MSRLKEKIAALLPEWRQRVTRLLKENGDVQVDTVKISQFYGGMRGLKCITTDISYLDPMKEFVLEDIRFRKHLKNYPKQKALKCPMLKVIFFSC